MITHTTLDAAREAAKNNPVAVQIVEIEHATEGRCYIVCKARMTALVAALRNTPIPEIRRVIAEHTIRTPEEIEIERREYLRDHCRCERCGAKVDGNTAYSQQEWGRLGGQRIRVTAWYCESCRTVLQAIGAGEYTAMQERADEVPSYEPYTKED